jgi:putative transcriptional regulator
MDSLLAPGILIAAPPLGDPNFERSVVFLVSHNDEGAFGWVINGQSVMTLQELLVRAEITKQPRDLRGVVRRGGPVSEEQVWLLFPEEERLLGLESQFPVAPGVLVTASRDALEALQAGAKIEHLRAFSGYAGWGPGQLEREIREGAWLPGAVDADFLFGVGADTAWQRAYERLGLSPMAFASRVVGSA